MAKSKDHISKSVDFQRYLNGEMSSRERHNFEKLLLEDDFENEAFEGISEIKTSEFNADLHDLRNRIKGKTEQKNVYVIWRMAAALLLLGVFSFIVYFLINFNSTNEIVQSKQFPIEEKQEISSVPETEEHDSLKEESDQIIAYQQKPDTKSEDKQARVVERRPVLEKAKTEELPNESLAATASDEESVDNEVLIKAAQPAELPTIKKDQGLEAPMELESSQRKKEAVSQEVVPPSARLSQEGFTARFDRNVRTITGKVFSKEDDEAIPGVNITMKGSASGTVTDMDGNYTINVPTDKDVTLVYSSVGYSSEEVEVKDDDNINVNIEPDVNSLSEIVVTGYGNAKDAKDQSYSYTPPQPVGGNNAFKDYVKNNLKYPSAELKKKIKGTVKLKFTVGTDGKISNITVLKSLGEDFDIEAIRMLNDGPGWDPAVENDSLVVKDVKVKIRFNPPE